MIDDKRHEVQGLCNVVEDKNVEEWNELTSHLGQSPKPTQLGTISEANNGLK
jgi:hypothetical protein